MARRFTRLTLVLAIAVASVAGSISPASAAFSNDPDTTWMTNGIVYSVVTGGGRIYVGGKFKSLRRCPTGVTCPDGTIKTVNVGALDAATGEGVRTFKVTVAGDGAIVYALAVLNGRLYIGGKFTSVNGEPRSNLAAVDATTGALVTDFSPEVGTTTEDYVRGMLSHDGMLYVAGKFKSIDGATRQRLAAFGGAGQLDGSWRPRTSGLARSFATTCDGSQIIVGGSFEKAAGTGGTFQNRKLAAIFDKTTGSLDPWATVGNISSGTSAYDLAATCDALIMGSGASNHLFRYDLSDDTGDLIWDLHTGGNVQTVALYGNNRILFGGHFANTPANPDTNQKVSRTRFATVDLDGFAYGDWTPSFDGKFFGPWDILVRGNQVWVGGQFTQVSGNAQFFIARFTDLP
jgi:hypothetical protein